MRKKMTAGTTKGRGGKASLRQLTSSTHKGRKVKGLGSKPNPLGPHGQRAHGKISADPRLLSASLGHVSPTPKGPEPGRGGTTY
jgi:hypothetical protein